MKSSKALYSVAFKEYELSDKKIFELQKELLTILLDIKNVCDDNNIQYMLSGGTLLGAIRHKGFIPWDDDIDIMMTRDEFVRFRKVFKKKLINKYILAEPLMDKFYLQKSIKVFKRKTSYVEIPYMKVPKYNMLFIDIFIVENIPDNRLKRKIFAGIYDFAFKASSTCIDYLYPSPLIEKKSQDNKELKSYYNMRKRLGFIFSHIGGVHFYLKICDYISKCVKKSRDVGIPSAISYEREVFPRLLFEEIEKVEFCGYSMNAPKAYDRYLNNLYGDYMTIPPVEKRERHSAYKIKY